MAKSFDWLTESPPKTDYTRTEKSTNFNIFWKKNLMPLFQRFDKYQWLISYSQIFVITPTTILPVLVGHSVLQKY